MNTVTRHQLITTDGIEKLQQYKIPYTLQYEVADDDPSSAFKYRVFVETEGGPIGGSDVVSSGRHVLGPKVLPDFGSGEKLYVLGEAMRKFHIKYAPTDEDRACLCVPTKGTDSE